MAKGKAAAAAYLGRARAREGVVMGAAVDTLLLRLLADVGDAAALEALVTRRHLAEPGDAAAALRGAGRWHALALMMSCGGRGEEALRVWKVGGIEGWRI